MALLARKGQARALAQYDATLMMVWFALTLLLIEMLNSPNISPMLSENSVSEKELTSYGKRTGLP